MPAPTSPRIFISYAVKDGSVAARTLRQRLEAEGFAIWQDVVALEGGRDWWSQIEEAIRAPSVEHLVLVVSPEAMNRPVVRRELRLAKTLGKQVTPVQSGPELDLGSLPRWLGHVLDASKTEHWAQLVKAVAGPSQQLRMPMMAPEPPADFVSRPSEFDALKRELLDAKGDAAVGITAALRGAGGYGKTTLAKALAHDPDIQEAYFDGILWVELGEKGSGRVVALISDLVTLITGKPPAIATREAAASALADALGDRRFLLIIDDVWQRSALDPFLMGGASTTRLVTTRFDRELPNETVRQPVDAMAPHEALTLLSWGLPASEVTAQTIELQALSARLGEWAQLLKLVNGFLRDRIVKHRQALPSSLQDVTRRLEARGLAAFDDKRAANYDSRHRSVAAAINTTLELLEDDQRARFRELGIFPEDADVPIGIVSRLWAETGSLDEIATEDLLRDLFDLSLLLGLDLEHRTFRFHDTTRHFLQDQAGKAGLTAQHQRLLRAIDDMGGVDDRDQGARIYFYEYLPEHLAGAGDRGTLDALLLDPSWLQAKLAATSSPQSLVADYELHGAGQMQSLIGRTLRLITGICVRDHAQLLPQLLGRLMGNANPDAQRFLAQARRQIRAPALLTQSRSLAQPGAEVARLEATHYITAMAVLPDGRLAAATTDWIIRLWDPITGAETARIESGHNVSALAVLPDGLLASGSHDETVRVWDPGTGVETARLKGADYVNALVVLPDGRLVTGSGDWIIRLWDVTTSTQVARLEGHSRSVKALAVFPDGRLASGSQDETIRIWDTSTGAEITRIDCPSIIALTVLPDGRLASGSLDHVIRLWDPRTGSQVGQLDGHAGFVYALAALPDGRLLSGAEDNSIRLWDLKTSSEVARLEGHAGHVDMLAVLPDRRWASASRDETTIRLWDPTAVGAVAAQTEGHTAAVRRLLVLPDGRLASGSADKTIRLWDTLTRRETARLDVLIDEVASLAILPDGRLAAGLALMDILLWDLTSAAEPARLSAGFGSTDALAVLPDGRLATGRNEPAITLWDWKTGAEAGRLEGHEYGATALLVLPDGRLVSGSATDQTIRLWDPVTGAETARLERFGHGVMALLVLPDGQLVSASYDNSIRFWDLRTGAETGVLEGHSNSVNTIAMLPDGRLASGSEDKTIRLWDLSTRSELARLEVDAAVESLVALSGTDDTGSCLVAGDAMGRLHWLEIVA